MPERIQLRRTKGWRKPPGAIVVARPTMWGNPFTTAGAIENGFADNETDARKVCVDAYRDWLAGHWSWADGNDKRDRIIEYVATLRGYDLACWCPLDQPCHADILLALANQGASA